MGTLYDLLGALPDDNAEGLRTAFRKAAKASHPDLNPDNPEAALRFRQLVRAHDILSDAEQRATYNQLLAIALKPPPPPPKSNQVYEKVHRFASSTLAATIITAILVASYTLMGFVSRAPVAAESTVGIAGSPHTEIASAIPRSVANEVFATGAVAPAVNPRGPWVAGAGPVPHLAMKGAKFVRADPDRAFTDFDPANPRDRSFVAAYLNGGLIFYPKRDVSRAFADMEHARRLAKTKHVRASPPPRPSTVYVMDMPVRRARMIAAITP